MQTIVTSKYKEYAPVLKRMGVRYKESEHWYIIGKADAVNKWLLYISVRTSQANELIEQVLPVLVNRKVSFKVLRNQALVNQVNGSAFDLLEAGKVVTIYPVSVADAIAIVAVLEPLTCSFKGQFIVNCTRIGEVLYTGYSGDLVNGKPPKIPFAISDKNKAGSEWLMKWAMIRKGFIPVELIRCYVKGYIYKAVNLRNFQFCVVKWGRAYAADDLVGRNIRHRLLWQRQVLNDLYGFVPVPRFIKYFDLREDSFLIMEFIEGQEIGSRIRQLLNGQDWKDASADIQADILTYYLRVLQIIERMHQRRYVHRDITHINFIIRPGGEICVLDMELNYLLSCTDGLPPFQLGTEGYYAPEQEAGAIPTVKEDLFSLGALLSLFLTGESPKDFIERDLNYTRRKLLACTQDAVLSDMVYRCIQYKPDSRPELRTLIQCIADKLKELNVSVMPYKKAI
jgi:serine/threonine protein kinase